MAASPAIAETIERAREAGIRVEDVGEAWAVLDALADGECAEDALAEHRFWRSGRGRRQEADEAWDSGHRLEL